MGVSGGSPGGLLSCWKGILVEGRKEQIRFKGYSINMEGKKNRLQKLG